MLDEDLKSQLQGYLQRISQPVRIDALLDDSAESAEMHELLHEIVALSPLLSLTETRVDGAGQHQTAGTQPGAIRCPSFALSGATTEQGVRFAGIPMGHEFTSLVLALLQTGGYPARVEQQVLEQIRALPGELSFETYISLTCQNCPDVVQALNLMAVTNPRVRHVMIDGALFQHEVADRKIMAVPTVYLNGQPFGSGRMTVEEIVARLDSGAAERQAAELSQRAPYDVLVIGGGPAGAAAAIYAARKGIRTGVVSERFGGQVLDTLGIENFISVKETEGPRLAAGLEEHVRSYDVDIMNLQRASKLVPGELIGVELASGAKLHARSVILATGARWREMNVPGEREYRGRGVAYCPHCDGPLFKGKRVAVVGGGNSGVEAAIDLAGIVAQVTLLEFDSRLRADEVLQRKLRSLGNVRVITSAQTTEVHGAEGKVSALSYKDRNGEQLHRLDLEGVFVQIGLVPNTDWLKGTVALSGRGEIEVDARGQTSVAGVFAAGDVTTVAYKQIVIAMGEGAKASLAAFDHLIRSPLPAATSNAA
ncbi:MAG: alkyl hydroperoxide reductase subunit F [Steroidobacteraceae bacterium]